MTTISREAGIVRRCARLVNRSVVSALFLFASPLAGFGEAQAAPPRNCSIDSPAGTIVAGDLATFNGSWRSGDRPYTIDWTFQDGDPASVTDTSNRSRSSAASTTFGSAGAKQVTMTVTDRRNRSCSATVSVNVSPAACVPTEPTETSCGDGIDNDCDGLIDAADPDCQGTGTGPDAANDTFVIDTAVVTRDGQGHVPSPGVLMNDSDAGGAPLTASLVSGPSNGTLQLFADGSFTYTPFNNAPGSDSFTYVANNGSADSDAATVEITVLTGLTVNQGQNQFNILMNYELGMHCTGFEFAYCCVLPPYNSILAQVVRTDKGSNDMDFPMLLQGDPNQNRDALNRETVLREPELDGNGNFRKYVLRYWHDAQPRNDGRGKPQSSTLISAVELNSMLMWNTLYDKTARDGNGSLVTGTYNGSSDVPIGDGTPDVGGYANGWLNHLYIYGNLEGHGNTGVDADKIHLGIDVPISTDCGPSLQPMGPVTAGGAPNDCGGASKGNLLTFSGETGTVVFTQMKVLEDLPITLTSPRIWEALGLPLTPFEDSIDFFGDPGLVDEDSIRPYVQMKAQLHNYDANAPDGVGSAVLDNGNPVVGFGTAPIDIPNCERCHSAFDTPNSPNATGSGNGVLVQQEISFWKAYYDIDDSVDSTWYARLKGAAISMLKIHDDDNGTGFTDAYPGTNVAGVLPQNTRLGHESVICQKCHADNVIAVVKSATGPFGQLIPPVTEAIHHKHRNQSEGGPILFADSLGRDGGCQGCHPAHRSDGDMDGYPITLGGGNFYAGSDNRLANGGCFVGRDVHSNPNKDVDGAETPSHLTSVGQWLADNVFDNQAGLAGSSQDTRGIWCTNCHTQLSQEIWKAENMVDLINGVPGKNANGSNAVNVRALSLQGIADAVAGGNLNQVLAWLDPTENNPAGDFTHAIWDPQYEDANVATIEVGAAAGDCAPLAEVFNGEFGVYVCGSVDGDGDFSVNILDFCTTPDCVAAAQATLSDTIAAPVPFRAATDGRDHWLAPGEPHCADCHAAPYTEQSGNLNAFAPFNYPRKASLMRYSRGHQDITCQGCHESIHGLYPVTPTIDTTSYAQAANLNHDDSHGPLKCGSCHAVGSGGLPSWIRGGSVGRFGGGSFDGAVGWAHTFTDEASPLGSVCRNCHGDESGEISQTEREWLRHAMVGRVSRLMMDKAEAAVGRISDTSDGSNGVCLGCHSNEANEVACNDTEWKQHLTEGRVSEAVWEKVSLARTGSTCGW